MSTKASPKALLVGRAFHLMFSLPQILSRAGFVVDVICSNKVLKYSRFVRSTLHLADDVKSFISLLSLKFVQNYDWIVITDEAIIKGILHSALSLREKLRLLPVQREENFSHLLSKIGLARALHQHGVLSPPFSVAKDRKEALLQADDLGYPILLKKDISSGGFGIYECRNPRDFETAPSCFFQEPLLIQKRILGIELDVSALFMQGELIHFNYAIPKKVLHPFGVSSLRTYRPLCYVEKPLFDALAYLGKALGLNGFSNVSCIEDSLNNFFFFEADPRPNAWLNYPELLGEDLSDRIKRWYFQKERLNYPVPAKANQPFERVVPHFLRLKKWEVLCNRYGVWRTIPKKESKMIAMILLRFFLAGLRRSLRTYLNKSFLSIFRTSLKKEI